MGVSTNRYERSDIAKMMMSWDMRAHQGTSTVEVSFVVASMMG